MLRQAQHERITREALCLTFKTQIIEKMKD